MTGRVTRRTFAFGAAALGAVRPAALRAATFEFKAASTLAYDHPSSVRAKQMWQAIERESGGRLRVQFFPNGMLGGNESLLSQLRLNAIQFYLNLGDFPALVPAVDITNVGFAFKNADEAFHAVDGPLGEYLRREFVAKGLYLPRTIWDSGMRQMTNSSRPLRRPEDMAGLKVRIANSRIAVDFFRTLGASPVFMGIPELYTALQTHVVDGADNPLATIEAYRHYEVQRYLSLTSHTWSGLGLVVNGEAWKSMPSDLQDLFERNNTKFALLERRDAKVLTLALTDKLGRQGLEVNRPDLALFRARLQTYYASWSNTLGATAWGLLQNSVGKLG